MSADPAGTNAKATMQTKPEVQLGRRRLLRGGLAVPPVLLSVASRPVSAGECMSCSAWTSMTLNTSHTHSVASTCGGKPPEYWMLDESFPFWPAGCVPVTTTVSAATLFDAALPKQQVGYGYPGKTLLDVLRLPATTGRDGAARHLVAALFNCYLGTVPSTVMDAYEVKAIWQPIDRGKAYEPSAGIKMYPDYCVPAAPTGGGLIFWLRTTMT